MRWKGLVWTVAIVLLAESPALAKMHTDSPPSFRSLVFILIWIGLMTWLFRSSYGTGQASLAFGVGTVATAIVLGEYVDSLLRLILGAGDHDKLAPALVVPCVCLVSVVAQGTAAVWAGRLQGARPIGFVQALRVPAFWGIAVLPGVYVVLKLSLLR